MTTENPFDGRAHGDHVFRTRPERNFFIGRLSPSQQKKWLRDHPERWQTREDALRDLQALAGTDVEAEPAEPCSTTSANEVRPPVSAETRISPKWNRRCRRHHHRRSAAAAPTRRPAPVEMRRARGFGDVFGDPSRRDKEHHRASRKCRREKTTQSEARQLVWRGLCCDCPAIDRCEASLGFTGGKLASGVSSGVVVGGR